MNAPLLPSKPTATLTWTHMLNFDLFTPDAILGLFSLEKHSLQLPEMRL